MHLGIVVSSVRDEILTMKEKKTCKKHAYNTRGGADLIGGIDTLSSATFDQQMLVRQDHDNSAELSDRLTTKKDSLLASEDPAVQTTDKTVPSWRSKSSICTCLCYQRRSKRTARSMSRVFGALYVAYSGVPYLNTRCRSCNALKRRQRTQTDVLVSFTYFFPAWLLPWAVRLVVERSQPRFDYNFRIFHCVSYSSRIFQCAYQGDIVGMKSILQKKAGSPFDVTSEPQHSLLVVSCTLPYLSSKVNPRKQVAASRGHNEICDILIHAGADPFAVDFRNRYV